MSTNLDLVRSIVAPFERGDFSRTDWADPEIEYVAVDGPEPGSATGLVGLAEAMRSMFSGIEDIRAEAEEYRELDTERVLVLTHGSGRGKTSSVPVVQRGAEVFEFASSAAGNEEFVFRFAASRIDDGRERRFVRAVDARRRLADDHRRPCGDGDR